MLYTFCLLISPLILLSLLTWLLLLSLLSSSFSIIFLLNAVFPNTLPTFPTHHSLPTQLTLFIYHAHITPFLLNIQYWACSFSLVLLTLSPLSSFCTLSFFPSEYIYSALYCFRITFFLSLTSPPLSFPCATTYVCISWCITLILALCVTTRPCSASTVWSEARSQPTYESEDQTWNSL